MKYLYESFGDFLNEKEYTPGKGWSKDFDYDGMLKFALKVDDKTPLNVLQDLYDDMEDVNYHTEAGPLWDIINDLKRKRKVKFDYFQSVVRKTLNEGLVTGQWERLNEASAPLKDLKKKMPDHVKGWAKYVAQHANGEWWYYDDYPTMVKNVGWKSDDRDGYQFGSDVKTSAKGWEKSVQKIDESVTEGKTYSSFQIQAGAKKIMAKLKIGDTIVTSADQYKITGYGGNANAFREFEVEAGDRVAMKLRFHARGGKVEVNAPVSANWNDAEQEQAEEIITESVNENWVKAQLTGDAGGLDAGTVIMVDENQWSSTAPNLDVQIKHPKVGQVGVPKSFVQLSSDTGNGVIHESINSRVRAEIVVFLKRRGFNNLEDYHYSTGEFIANDMETAQDMADAIGNKYKVAIYDDRMTKDGRVPMMIVK